MSATVIVNCLMCCARMESFTGVATAVLAGLSELSAALEIRPFLNTARFHLCFDSKGTEHESIIRSGLSPNHLPGKSEGENIQ